MFTAALFLTAKKPKKGKQLTCLLLRSGHVECCMYIQRDYSGSNRKEILAPATAQMNLRELYAGQNKPSQTDRHCAVVTHTHTRSPRLAEGDWGTIS